MVPLRKQGNKVWYSTKALARDRASEFDAATQRTFQELPEEAFKTKVSLLKGLGFRVLGVLGIQWFRKFSIQQSTVAGAIMSER